MIHPEFCFVSPVELRLALNFAPGPIGPGRDQPEPPDQSQLRRQPSAFRPQPGQDASFRLAFLPRLAPLDNQRSSSAVYPLLARLLLLGD